MMLSGNAILKEIQFDNIRISNFDIKNLNPNSYNLTLANEILVYNSKILNTAVKNSTKTILIPKNGLLLKPNKIYLARTIEKCWASDRYVMGIDGRSSIGRLGIDVHKTAGFGDVGFNGVWTLEIAVTQPTIIYAGIKIAQVYFEQVQHLGTVPILYKGKYQDSETVQSSRLYRELS